MPKPEFNESYYPPRKLSEKEKNERISQGAVADYKKAVKAINEFFAVPSIKEICLKCVKKGQGCCVKNQYEYEGKMISPDYADQLVAVLKNQEINAVLKMRANENAELCRMVGPNGCIIPEIKPPVCAAFFCYPEKLRNKYGIAYLYEKTEKDLKELMRERNPQLRAQKRDAIIKKFRELKEKVEMVEEERSQKPWNRAKERIKLFFKNAAQKVRKERE